jgi:bifunctional non-homologous end joining protein LigD
LVLLTRKNQDNISDHCCSQSKNKGKLVSMGNVGTGFNDKSLKDLHTNLKKIIRTTSPLDVVIKETPDITSVKPDLVCNINFSEITDDGSVRHPVFQELRADKTANEVELEKPKHMKVE